MAKKEETINIDGIDYKLSELSQSIKKNGIIQPIWQ